MNSELYDAAIAIVRADSLAGKLKSLPKPWSDNHPGPALRLPGPGRPPALQITDAKRAKVPPVAGMADPAQRCRILNALANHELQAVELFAWALVAFPEAPKSFRTGLAAILVEEQLHCRLYIDRLEAHGHHFGEWPVTGHFWNHLDRIRSPRDFVCIMGLTFENANLDFALDYAVAAKAAGDHETAAVLDRVHRDELRHVKFAWKWMSEWSEGSVWRAFVASLAAPLSPGRARGRTVCVDSRRKAGLDDEFIDGLIAARPVRPSGASR